MSSVDSISLRWRFPSSVESVVGNPSILRGDSLPEFGKFKLCFFELSRIFTPNIFNLCLVEAAIAVPPDTEDRLCDAGHIHSECSSRNMVTDGLVNQQSYKQRQDIQENLLNTAFGEESFKTELGTRLVRWRTMGKCEGCLGH